MFRFFKKDTDEIAEKAKSKYFAYPFTSDKIDSIDFIIKKPYPRWDETGFEAKIHFNDGSTRSWQTIKAESFYELLVKVDEFIADRDEEAKEVGRTVRERQLEL